jgi:hypothetical protein
MSSHLSRRFPVARKNGHDVLVADGHIMSGPLGIGLLGHPQTEAMMNSSCTAKFPP